MTTRDTLGVAIGKFNPPHLGHAHLLATGAAQVDELWVLLCDRGDQTLPGHRRAEWLRDALPANVTVVVTPDDLPEQSTPWARRALALLPRAPDVAFTSESYGAEWASMMGARHVSVDEPRSTVPVSGTCIRADIAGQMHYLVPAARAALARRVVLIGGESCGKTTLATALARRLGTVWVPEVGRYYAEGRMHLAEDGWASDEFCRIARAQARLEDDLARRARAGVVVCDTDARVTAAWHQRYLRHDCAALESIAAERTPDLYLACAPDFAWVQDGTRESRDHREAMYDDMLARARASGARTVVVRGPPEHRVAAALDAIASLQHFPPLD